MITVVQRKGIPAMLAEMAGTVWAVLGIAVAPFFYLLGVLAKNRRDRVMAEVRINAGQITKLWATIDKMEKHSDAQDATIATQNQTIAKLNEENLNLQKLLREERAEKHALRDELHLVKIQNGEQAAQIATLQKQVNP